MNQEVTEPIDIVFARRIKPPRGRVLGDLSWITFRDIQPNPDYPPLIPGSALPQEYIQALAPGGGFEWFAWRRSSERRY